MTKNKWTVRLILLVTIILAGLIILFNKTLFISMQKATIIPSALEE